MFLFFGIAGFDLLQIPNHANFCKYRSRTQFILFDTNEKGKKRRFSFMFAEMWTFLVFARIVQKRHIGHPKNELDEAFRLIFLSFGITFFSTSFNLIQSNLQNVHKCSHARVCVFARAPASMVMCYNVQNIWLRRQRGEEHESSTRWHLINYRYKA